MSVNVLTKLSNARMEFHKLNLKKTGHNKFAGYHYFELGDFLIPALEVLHRNGLIGYVSFGETIATLTIAELDGSGKLEITSPMSSAALKGAHDIQNLGAVQTYLRRYLWVAAMEIVEHDAIDSSVGNQPERISAKPVAKDVFDNMNADDQETLRNIAMEAKVFLGRGKASDAVLYVKEQQLDADMSVALWSLFDSKERAAMTKASKELQSQQEPAKEAA